MRRPLTLAVPGLAAALMLALVPAAAGGTSPSEETSPTAGASPSSTDPPAPSEPPSETPTTEPTETEPTETESAPPPRESRTSSSGSEEPERQAQSGGDEVPEEAREAMLEHKQALADAGVRNLGKSLREPAVVLHGAKWDFKRGTVYWTRALGASAVWGATLTKYKRMGGPASVLGFPTDDERAARQPGARFSRFARGRIYWSRATGAHEIHGAIESRYIARGGARRLGLPVTDERPVGVARFNRLQKGRIYWARRTGPRLLRGAILGRYLRMGGPRAWIGLPVREEVSVRVGRRANFEHAGIVWHRERKDTRIVAPYSVTVHRVRRSEVRYTYRSGCPVGPAALRRMRIVFTNFAGDAAPGNLIVHKNVVGDLKRVFGNAHRARFNVRRVLPMDRYRGDDIRAMEADNTSAFNCRHVTGNPYRLSQHSYGNAIDINTFENPYVTSSRVYPSGARTYLNRQNVRKGMIVPGTVIAKTMRNRGWPWGARWSNPDYQHFSANGG